MEAAMGKKESNPVAPSSSSLPPSRKIIDISRSLLVPGWMSGEELLWLATTTSSSHNVVEIGSFCGRSSRVMGDHLPPDGSLYCVDSFKPFHCIPPIISSSEEGEAIHEQFLANMSDLLSSGKVSLLRMSSLQAATLISKKEGGWIDFLFIDGDHSYPAVSMDIAIWLPLMEKGGIISGHDYDIYEGVKKAVDERFGGVVERPAGSIWAVRL